MENQPEGIQKTKDELILYAVKMRQRGDRYRSILSYLEKNCENPEQVQEIIAIVDQMETKKILEVDHTQGVKENNTYNIFGYAFIAGGILLMIFLWNKGWVASVPFVMIGMGIYGIKEGKIKKPMG